MENKTSEKNRSSYSRRKARKIMKEHFHNLSINEVVHHIDGNCFNNDIHNLTVMDRGEHIKLHWKTKPWDPGFPRRLLSDRLMELESLLVVYNEKIGLTVSACEAYNYPTR